MQVAAHGSSTFMLEGIQVNPSIESSLSGSVGYALTIALLPCLFTKVTKVCPPFSSE